MIKLKVKKAKIDKYRKTHLYTTIGFDEADQYISSTSSYKKYAALAKIAADVCAMNVYLCTRVIKRSNKVLINKATVLHKTLGIKWVASSYSTKKSHGFLSTVNYNPQLDDLADLVRVLFVKQDSLTSPGPP